MKKICPYTKQEISNFASYLLKESAKRKISMPQLKILVLQETFGSLINKDSLYDLYIIREFSFLDFKEKYGLLDKDLKFLLDYFNIPKRSLSESKKTARTKQKIKENLGVENISQLKSVQDKRKKTCLDKYGVDNIWKAPEYFSKYCQDKDYSNNYLKNLSKEERIENGKKAWGNKSEENKKIFSQFHSKRMLLRWGKLTKEERKLSNLHLKKWYDSLSEDEKEKIIKERHSRLNKRVSKLETKVFKITLELGFKSISQYEIEGLKYDIFIPELNLVIEINGDYWHANPKYFQSEDFLNMNSKLKTAQELWDRDRIKLDKAINKGYKTIVIWEDEINSQENLIEYIKLKIYES